MNKKLLIIPVVIVAVIGLTFIRTQAIEQQGIQRAELARATEKAIFELVNEQRTLYDASTLKWHDGLAQLAREYAERAANSEVKFVHVVKDGYYDNVTECKNNIGENLAEGKGKRLTEEQDSRIILVQEWMHSLTGHRENILYENWIYTGVGSAISDDNRVYVVQVFCY